MIIISDYGCTSSFLFNFFSPQCISTYIITISDVSEELGYPLFTYLLFLLLLC